VHVKVKYFQTESSWLRAFSKLSQIRHPVFIAQHATATCCRGCISKWHGIEKGRALKEDEVHFVVDLILGWIEGQMNEKEGGVFRQ
jgi:hypothetical protein